MELNLKKPTLNLKKPTLELTKKKQVSPIKFRNGRYTQKALATTKMQGIASKMV